MIACVPVMKTRSLDEIVFVVERNVTERHLTVGHDPLSSWSLCPAAGVPVFLS